MLKDNVIINAANISKIYKLENHVIHALKDINLQIKQGSLVAITGKSGAGKSTLLHVLGSLEPPTSGQVFINNIELYNMSDKMISNFRNFTFGFVFQFNNLLPDFTAIENVMMPGLICGTSWNVVKTRASQLLKAVGLENRENHKPSELSGGEQQRVAIARALFMTPPVLMTDEPTGNLDQKTAYVIQDLILELCILHNITLLLVTHDKDLSKRLPYQIVMEDGHIIEYEL